MSVEFGVGDSEAAPVQFAQARGALRRRVALYGPYASRNLGDTATQMAAIANLRGRRGDLEIVGVSPDPADTLQSLAIASFPMSGTGAASGSLEREFRTGASTREFRIRHWPATVRRIFRFVGTLDMLIVSGGGQLDDFWGGAFGHPWGLLVWTAVARLRGVPVVFLAVGLDRLDTPLSRHFALLALRLSSLRSFRDSGTQTAMRKMGMRSASRICPDLVFALPLRDHAAPPTLAQGKFAVINPITQKTWSHGHDRRQSDYLEKLADAGQWLAAKGLALRIACSQTPMDGADAKRLQEMLVARGIANVVLCATPTVDAYIDQVRDAELVVGARLHGVILSLVAGSPVVALAPLAKVEQVMVDVGLGRYSLPLQSFRSIDLIERIDEMLGQVASVREQLVRCNADFRAQLSGTLDDVVGLLDGAVADGKNRHLEN